MKALLALALLASSLTAHADGCADLSGNFVYSIQGMGWMNILEAKHVGCESYSAHYTFKNGIQFTRVIPLDGVRRKVADDPQWHKVWYETATIDENGITVKGEYYEQGRLTTTSIETFRLDADRNLLNVTEEFLPNGRPSGTLSYFYRRY